MNSEFAIGTFSSLISYSLTHPINELKKHYLISNSNSKQKLSLAELNRLIYLEYHGMKGYYRGFSSTLLTYPLFWGIFFETRERSNVIVASGIASLITNPLFVLRKNFQSTTHNFDDGNQYNLTNRNKPIFRHVFYSDLAGYIYQREGISGFFRGFSSNLANNTKLWMQFPLYDKINEKTNSIILSSAIAKIATSALYYPINIIRTKQLSTSSRHGMFVVGRTIYNFQGFEALYSGFGLYNLVAIPSFSILMVCRNYIKKYYE